MIAIRTALCGIITVLFLSSVSTPALAEKNLDYVIIKVKKGMTLGRVLESTGIRTEDRKNAITELSNIYDPSRLLPGQIIKIIFEIMDAEGKDIRLSSMEIKLSNSQKIQVKQLSEDIFLANILESFNQPRLMYIHATVGTTLFSAAMNAGITHEMFNELIKAYSYDIDFQRDIKKGTEMEILYEGLYDKDDKLIGNGDVLYASLKVNDKFLPIYRYSSLNGKTEFYNKNGTSVKRSLLKTPVNGARISSNYGRRRHPILGYTKMHKGVDFAAPKGTPVYAAGDGRIMTRKRNGGYGKFIKIYHNATYTTAYAHLNGYARWIRRGSRVKQGQVIGYIGTTGRSTGPHLHFELRKKGKQVNPLAANAAFGKKLAYVEKKEFFKYRNSVQKTVARMRLKSLEVVAINRVIQ